MTGRTAALGPERPVTVAVIDYGMGNLRSVIQACRAVGMDATACELGRQIAPYDAVVIPGVGAMPDAMRVMHEAGFDSALTDFVSSGRPTMGICLGMQLLMRTGTEHVPHEGLGLVAGSVQRFPSTQTDGSPLKVPHIGWNAVIERAPWRASPLQDTPSGTRFYFVHSYYVIPADRSHVIAMSEYGGVEFCSALRSANIFGVQFHPEKSGNRGLDVWRQFRDQAMARVNST
jgi:glutamine amidotransferase